MIGTLLRMNGAPDRDAFNDIVLRWLVMGADGGEDDIEDASKIGRHLLEIYMLVNVPEGAQEEARQRQIDGQELYNVMFTAYCRGYAPRIVRELKRRGLDYEHINQEWVRDRECFGWFEGFDLSTAVFPEDLAKKVAYALGENAAADSIQIWAMHESLDRERASV
jgi:hypothetical protein